MAITKSTGPGWFDIELEPAGPFGRTRWTIVFAEGLALTGVRWGTKRAVREMRHYYEQLRKVQ